MRLTSLFLILTAGLACGPDKNDTETAASTGASTGGADTTGGETGVPTGDSSAGGTGTGTGTGETGATATTGPGDGCEALQTEAQCEQDPDCMAVVGQAFDFPGCMPGQTFIACMPMMTCDSNVLDICQEEPGQEVYRVPDGCVPPGFFPCTPGDFPLCGDSECEGLPEQGCLAAPDCTAILGAPHMEKDGKSGDETVDKPYCFNSVGAFSNINDLDDTPGDSYMIRPFAEGGAEAPYSIVVNIGPGEDDRALRDVKGVVLESGVAGGRFGDPFNPLFLADIDELAQGQIAERKDDPNLQIWYLGNEIGVFDKGAKTPGVRDFRRYLWSDCAPDSTIDAPKCARHALAGFLRERYADLPALNTAWESKYPGTEFSTIVDVGPRPVPYVSDCNQQCRVDLQVFVHDRLLKTWVEVITTRVRAADPNHIISAPRMAIGASTHFRFWTPASAPKPDVWVEDGTTPVPTDTAEVKYSPLDLLKRDGESGFDLVAFNIYTGDGEFEKPWFTDGVHLIHEESSLPIIISEFSVRAKIDGWSNKGGANWHAWSDRYLEADAAHQINMGLFRCEVPRSGHTAGDRWPEIDDRIAAVNCDIMDLIAARTGL